METEQKNECCFCHVEQTGDCQAWALHFDWEAISGEKWMVCFPCFPKVMHALYVMGLALKMR